MIFWLVTVCYQSKIVVKNKPMLFLIYVYMVTGCLVNFFPELILMSRKMYLKYIVVSMSA